MTLLIDVFRKDYVEVWLRLEGFSTFDDLSLEECATDEIGSRPEWLECELNNMHWGDLLECESYFGADHPSPGWLFSHHRVMWALHEGIAPGQPFRVRFWEPEYHTDYYSGETDVDYNWEIVEVVPWPFGDIVRSWSALHTFYAAQNAKLFNYRTRLKEKQRSDMSALVTRTDLYFGDNQRYWDEMEMPRGVRITLLSRHTTLRKLSPIGAGVFLAQGYDDGGDRDKAREKLFEDAVKIFPTITREFIEKLPRS